jgi:hypothetical protein
MKNKMKNPTRAVLLVTCLATLAACSSEPGVGSTFFREAGTQLDMGEFGNATLHNQLVQTCKSSGFGKAGAVAGDPVVVLDPQSTPERKVYRVHCDGRLDGKFAQIIYREYVNSATQKATVSQADSE